MATTTISKKTKRKIAKEQNYIFNEHLRPAKMEMSDDEIARAYKLAKHKEDEILTLSELNACGTAVIREILAHKGLIDYGTIPKDKMKWDTKSVAKLRFLVATGNKTRLIAETFGCSMSAVRNAKIKYLKNKGE